MTQAFNEIIDILNRLMGPQGCPWDREQTLLTMRTSVLEEVFEVIEAIDSDNSEHIKEELGDLFFNVIFLCALAEKEKKCSLEEVLIDLANKLIRRHPHVFGEISINRSDEVMEQWDKIKKEETEKQHRKSVLDGIPKDLSTLAKGQKMLKRMHKKGFYPEKQISINERLQDEISFGQTILNFIAEAQTRGIDAEQALRTTLLHYETQFRQMESETD